MEKLLSNFWGHPKFGVGCPRKFNRGVNFMPWQQWHYRNHTLFLFKSYDSCFVGCSVVQSVVMIQHHLEALLRVVDANPGPRFRKFVCML